MEKYYFNEAQPRLTVGDGVVLLLINGKEETEVMDGMPNENGLATTEAVVRRYGCMTVCVWRLAA